MNQYSIGEFAKQLGVTPDFLKYYEKMGILLPTVNQSGYRFYRFWERGQVLECIKLRNCGFTSREVVELLNAGSLEEYLKKIHARQLQLRDQLEHLQAQMLSFDSLSVLSRNFGADSSWEIRNMDGFYFLPQADYDCFDTGREVGAATKSWMPWMPTVHSTVRYDRFVMEPAKISSPKIGFTVPEAFAREHGLVTADPVVHVETRRWLVIYLKDTSIRPASGADGSPSKRQLHYEIARDILEKHSLRPLDSEYYIIKLLQLRESDILTNYSIMQIPIK